jgi:hypothetical protein
MTAIEMVQQMRDEALACNLHMESYDRLFGHAGALRVDVAAIYGGEYQELLRARRAVSPEVWEQYRLMEVTGLWEQDNLAKAVTAFRKAARSLYEKTKPKRTPKGPQPVEPSGRADQPTLEGPARQP